MALVGGPMGEPVASWVEARIQVALWVDELGYAMAAIFELTGLAHLDEVLLAQVEFWAERLQVDCLVLAELELDDRVVALADRARLRLLWMDPGCRPADTYVPSVAD